MSKAVKSSAAGSSSSASSSEDRLAKVIVKTFYENYGHDSNALRKAFLIATVQPAYTPAGTMIPLCTLIQSLRGTEFADFFTGKEDHDILDTYLGKLDEIICEIESEEEQLEEKVLSKKDVEEIKSVLTTIRDSDHEISVGKIRFRNVEGPCSLGYHFSGAFRIGESSEDGNRWHGNGKTYRPDGTLKHEGNFQNSWLNGQGKLYYEDGATIRYEGDWKEDRWHGNGKKYYPNGALEYEGNFQNDWPNRQGKLYYKDGTTLKYEGDWKNNSYHGNGKSYRPDGTLEYEGNFKNGNRHGPGKSYNLGTSYDFTNVVYENGMLLPPPPVTIEPANTGCEQLAARSSRKRPRES